MSDNIPQWSYYPSQEGNTFSSPTPRRGVESCFPSQGSSEQQRGSELRSPHTPRPNLFPEFQIEQSMNGHSQGSKNCSYESSPSMDTATSPAKKRKNITSGHGGKGKGISRDSDCEVVEKRGTPNKRWMDQHTEFLLQILVEEEKRGNKPQKRYKPSSINHAATEVNKKFGESYTAENINNHLKSWKAKWVTICQARDLSGAGWDDEHKVIIFDDASYRDLSQSKSKLCVWLNTPLPHYELLKVVCGEDHATGHGRKVVYQSFGQSIDSPLDIADNLIDVDNVVDLIAQQQPPCSKAATSDMKAGGSRRRRERNEPFALNVLMERVEKIATTIDNGFAMIRNKDLGMAIASMDGFDQNLLLDAYTKLYGDPAQATFFIGMSPFARIEWMNRFANEKNAQANESDEPTAPSSVLDEH